jgi:hypothetical protein
LNAPQATPAITPKLHKDALLNLKRFDARLKAFEVQRK